MSSLNAENAEWVDGPTFVEWLWNYGMTSRQQFGPKLARRINDWQKGGTASIELVDECLVHLPYSLHDLPDDIWRDKPVKGPKSGEKRRVFPITFKQQAVRRCNEGESPTAIAQDLGVSPRTIHVWRANKRAGDTTLDAVASPGLREGG